MSLYFTLLYLVARYLLPNHCLLPSAAGCRKLFSSVHFFLIIINSAQCALQCLKALVIIFILALWAYSIYRWAWFQMDMCWFDVLIKWSNVVAGMIIEHVKWLAAYKQGSHWMPLDIVGAQQKTCWAILFIWKQSNWQKIFWKLKTISCWKESDFPIYGKYWLSNVWHAD